LLKKYSHEINYCTFCPKLCRFACPVAEAEARETVTPTNRMVLLHLMDSGAIDMTEDEAEVFYHCLGCRLCRAYCKHRTDVFPVMTAARREAFKQGLQPESVIKFMQKYSEYGNPYGAELDRILDGFRQERRINKTAPMIYFIGSEMLKHYPRVVEETIELMELCELDFAIYGGPPLSCGSAALFAGDYATFEKTARQVAGVLNSYETVISGDPGALAVMAEEFPKAGAEMKARMIHTAEWLAGQAGEGRIEFGEPTGERVMYHDPCYMAKYLNVIDEPRLLLEKMYLPENIIEFSWNRDKNYCCGGGGLLPVTSPGVSEKIAERRLEEYHEAAPDMLITSCPTCERTFQKADERVNVVDIVSAVHSHLKK